MDLDAITKLWDEIGADPESRRSGPDTAERYRGVLLGVAVGNLLGIPVEGRNRERVRERFPQGLRDIPPEEKGRKWDDDLAQTALLAEALLVGDRLSLKDLAERLVQWAAENGRGMGNLTRRVIKRLERGTPASEAARLVWEDDRDPRDKPAGNGAVMRCSPVALKWRRHPQPLVEESLRSAQVTHYDPRCQWSTAVVNIALAHLLEGRIVALSALAAALDEAGAPESVGEAVRFVEGRSLEAMALEERPAMGYTLKAMQVGLWALTWGDNFEEALVHVVNMGGDTDTNGAVAGAILGGRYGADAIPRRWIECIFNRERLEELALQLLRASQT